MQYLIAGLIMAAIIGGLYMFWRRKRSTDDRMVSLVALLREPQFVDAGVVARAAGEAWGADLGDGQSEEEGPDGFVVGSDEMPTIAVRYHERMFLIHRFTQPYVENPEEVAAKSADMRV